MASLIYEKEVEGSFPFRSSKEPRGSAHDTATKSRNCILVILDVLKRAIVRKQRALVVSTNLYSAESATFLPNGIATSD